MNAKIYALIDPRTDRIRYVGKTTQPVIKRIYQHMGNHHLNRVKSHKNSWLKSLKEDGYTKPEYVILDNVPKKNWIFWEMYWISQLKAYGCMLVNMTDGGEGCLGGTGSLGYRHTQEAKDAISEANSGSRKNRPEWVKNSAEANKKPILQYSKSGDFIEQWDSATDAAIYLGDKSKKKNISSALNGRRNSAYGYIWKFKSVELQDKEPVS